MRALSLTLIGLVAATLAAWPVKPVSADDNQVNCTLSVPADPLSAQGLATPYRLGSDGCHERDPNAATFVQAAVFDPATARLSVYDPLVIDRGSDPAITPVVPVLPAGAVVGIWVGFNGTTLRLKGPGAGACVQGVDGSVFSQNAFCGTDALYSAANAAIAAQRLTPPDLGTAVDGMPCPSSRDFSLVDQDQSDNTTTHYLITRDGRVAQDVPLNVGRLPNAKIAFNGSDEGVVDLKLDPALGCSPWTVPDLADTTGAQQVTAWPLNELQAATHQADPVALVPARDPFVLVDSRPDLGKLNAYRAGVDQAPVDSLDQASTTAYCRNLLRVGLPRIVADRPFTQAAPSPFPQMANSLYTFMAQRFMNTFSKVPPGLGCTSLLGVRNPVSVRTDDDVVVSARISLES